ncbi:hypothetical protein HPP92_016754 [Vanilla planifolia]|uniref:EF-hand domain-containing protein n=1 Tax=Vanilla planifolia TaxID=51239 RepID=A0A835USD5_VANPL|nr:hypothetical protein HPP92_016754 [Vanilla planifolia]
MAFFAVFALLFLFGLLNSLIGSNSKLLPRLRSLFLSAISPKKSTIPKAAKAHNKSDATTDESTDLRTIFATFDADGDGYISDKELAESLRRLGICATGDEVKSMIERVDANGDGLIDLDEFKELYDSLGVEGGGKRAAGEEADGVLRDAFQVFDENGDGLITVEELRSVLRSLGLRQGDRPEACRDMIERVDLDGDGMVNFDEFKEMMATKGGMIF